jgi:glucan phosphoethanolaminetransferase (alkaline phosphatase superfamily)
MEDEMKKILIGIIVLLAIFLAYQILMVGLNIDLFMGFSLSEIFQQEGGGLFALGLIGIVAILIIVIFQFVPRRK